VDPPPSSSRYYTVHPISFGFLILQVNTSFGHQLVAFVPRRSLARLVLTYLNRLRKALLAREEINAVSPHPVNCDHPGGQLPPVFAHKGSKVINSWFRPLPEARTRNVVVARRYEPSCGGVNPDHPDERTCTPNRGIIRKCRTIAGNRASANRRRTSGEGEGAT